ncbi:MAG TPA: glycoside hydrolase family 3 N-terminal domain-containing protein [Bacteroidota bacterium]|nr:glycoside hydrolase family 3 N-terminal domain-containing protein [Bacteroidota bacterium]
MNRPAILVPIAALAALLVDSCTPPPSTVPAGVQKRPGAPSALPLAEWSTPGAVDTLLASMTLDEKVSQMVMVRASGHYFSTDSELFERLERLVSVRRVGGIIMAQGDVYSEAVLLNRLQSMSRIPLLVAADFERGIAMRVRRGTRFPDAMALGATRNAEYAYRMGKTVALEARAIGIHQNYAPVADVNDNPLNPVINTRAFGDDPMLVRTMVGAFIRGTIDGGCIATAKHFPGHGDSGTDSHLDLPVIDLSRARLDSVELASFRAAVEAGVQSVMIGHLAVPALDSLGLPASLSAPMVSGLLRNEIGFRGLIVTDGLEMRALTRGFTPDTVAVLAVRAGADVLLVPPDPDLAVNAILGAIRKGEITEERVNESVRRMLALKHQIGLDRRRTVDIESIASRIGTRPNRHLAREIARDAVTLLKNRNALLPLPPDGPMHIVALLAADVEDDRTDVDRPGSPAASEPVGTYFSQLLRRRSPGTEILRLSPESDARETGDALARIRRADVAILCLFVRVRTASGKIDLPEYLRAFAARASETSTPLVVLAFGNPYIAGNIPDAGSIMCLYGDDEPVSEAAAEALFGEIPVHGRLPVSIPGKYPFGSGQDIPQTQLRRDDPAVAGFDPEDLQRVDGIVTGAIADSAFPGAQLAIVKDGLLVYDRSFGRLTYDPASPPVDDGTMYDLASLTKAIATTSAVMKMADSGKIGLDDPVAKYIPAFGAGEKAAITIRDLLLHRGGFPPFRRLWLECPDPAAVMDTIAATPLVAPPGDTTIYSDLGFITLGKIVEKVAGMPLDAFVKKEFFVPLRMRSTMYVPPESLRARCAPTEADTAWRRSVVQGTVHDENAAFLGGVSGNAGLFSTASDLALYMQMLFNKGLYAGRRYIGEKTVSEFIEKRGPGQERWLGWDMRSPRGSSAGAFFSGASFGHTGFTGTCIWADPTRNLAVIFLTNRVYPTRANQRIARVRPAVNDAVMRALGATVTGQ